MSQSPLQRFLRELRRRHVPQTAAIYLVAAWAAIEFSDVVVPNLDGPQWVVTAVIVAALVGFPVVLVLAWMYDWGSDGVTRTRPEAASTAAEGRETGTEADAGAATSSNAAAQPWLPVVAVLVVAVGSALAAAAVIQSGEGSAAPPVDGGETAGQGVDPATRPSFRSTEGEQEPREVTDFAGPDGAGQLRGLEAIEGLLADSIRTQMLRSLGDLDSVDLSELAGIAEAAAARAGPGVFLREPPEWRLEYGGAPATLTQGDTLRIAGVAVDTAGVVRVVVDGRVAVEVAEAQVSLPFEATLVARESAGTREVAISAFTGDGREIRQIFTVLLLPGGTP